MDLDNIYDYVTRYEINYIVYHQQHLRTYGDVAEANSLFNTKYQEQIQSMIDEGKIADIAKTETKGNKASDSLVILDKLQNGSLIESTLDEIAKGINQGLELSIQQVNWDNYMSIIQNAKTFSNLFNEDQNFSTRLNQFFELILQAMQQANLLSLDVLDGLTRIGTRLGGTSFSIPDTWKSKVIPISKEDQMIADKVILYLSNAADKVGANQMSARSFAVTINYIFTKTVGNKLYNMMIASGLAAAQKKCDSIFNNMVKEGKLKWVDRGAQTPVLPQSGKADIISSLPLSLVAIQNGQEYDIEIANSTEIKWPSRNMDKGIIHIIGQAKIGQMFSEQPEKYLAYNMIAHRGVSTDFDEAFGRIRAYTAASFFKGWINDNHFKTVRRKKAQFLMVNGKVYPVQRIINNICNEIMRNGAEDMISITGRGKQVNKWVGKRSSISDALKRSVKVNQVINTLTIAATLNNNILSKYAY